MAVSRPWTVLLPLSTSSCGSSALTRREAAPESVSLLLPGTFHSRTISHRWMFCGY